MKTKVYIQKAAFLAILVLGMQFVYAAFSFTGLTGEKERSNKYSLKNLSALSHKGSVSISSIKSNLQYKGMQQLSSKNTNSGVEMTSLLRYENGNTTFVYPYKFKIKVSKFKTPTP
ncbi:hypothetical protein [Sediminibacterium soli]|uniref:hypothetical protein n=1 Tax=Sediminibacterium soli TaxID=2698829 RepID=UPI00137A3436|nr:hypothetical protein [Sediminibacterium soli]NCI47928.1 hypothetical protein [Sediminibacterium soli]